MTGIVAVILPDMARNAQIIVWADGAFDKFGFREVFAAAVAGATCIQRLLFLLLLDGRLGSLGGD
jgi:hypothetical protein